VRLDADLPHRDLRDGDGDAKYWRRTKDARSIDGATRTPRAIDDPRAMRAAARRASLAFAEEEDARRDDSRTTRAAWVAREGDVANGTHSFAAAVAHFSSAR
jgi:hypothetical protein